VRAIAAKFAAAIARTHEGDEDVRIEPSRDGPPQQGARGAHQGGGGRPSHHSGPRPPHQGEGRPPQRRQDPSRPAAPYKAKPHRKGPPQR